MEGEKVKYHDTTADDPVLVLKLGFLEAEVIPWKECLFQCLV
jgi:hypothetical protein